LGAFTLTEASENTAEIATMTPTNQQAKKKSAKEVQAVIKSIGNDVPPESDAPQAQQNDLAGASEEGDEQFVVQPSKAQTSEVVADLPTLQTIVAAPSNSQRLLFAPYTFFLSRETPRALFEFMVRSFGGRIGWPASQGQGSPIMEDDDSITHIIIDRPITELSDTETAERRNQRFRRKYVQPQWVVDCINAGRILLEDYYAQGKMLPPHLSPFEEQVGGYEHLSSAQKAEDSITTLAAAQGFLSDDPDSSEEEDTEGAEQANAPRSDRLLKEAMDDEGLLRDAELTAETLGVDAATFDRNVAKLQSSKGNREKRSGQQQEELDMNKMLMSNKQRKLYSKLKFTETKRANEQALLERKRRKLSKHKDDRA